MMSSNDEATRAQLMRIDAKTDGTQAYIKLQRL